MNLALWAIPVAAFLTALALLLCQFRRTRSKRLLREKTHRAIFSIAESAEAPALTSAERQALGLPGPVSTGSGSSEARDLHPLSRENLEPLCRKFRIREVSLLPSARHACGRAEANLEILVEFEPKARVDYPVFFRLRHELFMLLGRQVNLVCKNSAELEAQREAFAQEHVLYA